MIRLYVSLRVVGIAVQPIIVPLFSLSPFYITRSDRISNLANSLEDRRQDKKLEKTTRESSGGMLI